MKSDEWKAIPSPTVPGIWYISTSGQPFFGEIAVMYGVHDPKLPHLVSAAKELRDQLENLVHAYVRLLEAGKDRIESCGGTCDSVEEMERGDPHLISAKSALSKAQGPV